MQGRQDEMPRQACLNGNLRSLDIADLANHDDIRILSKNGPQRLGKRQVRTRIDLNLPYSGKFVLDGILDCHYVQCLRIESSYRRIQRRRFAGSGRASDKDDPMRLMHKAINSLSDRKIHTKRPKIQLLRILVQQAKHHPLAMIRRNRRHSNIYRSPRNPDSDSAILRHSPFRYVEIRHNLDAGNHRGMKRPAGSNDVAQRAVLPKSNNGRLLERLDMYI
jgi:hypothetical protein